jgi:signal transduction histidine kinase/DNA-binding NarL/FixJ family response regulator
LRVLLVEDNPGDAHLVQILLHEEPDVSIELDWYDQLGPALDRVAKGDADVALLDLFLPDSQGLETFLRLQQAVPRLPVVVWSGLSDPAVALAAVQHGAQDFLVKGQVTGATIARTLRYAVERASWLAAMDEARAEAEAASRHLAVLADLSLALAEPLEVDAILRCATACLARTLADLASVDLVAPDGTLQRVVSGSAESETGVADLRALELYAPQPGVAHPAWGVLASGETLSLAEIDPAFLAGVAQNETHAALLTRLPLRSALLVPLRVPGGETLGLVTLSWAEAGRAAEPRTMATAELAASRMALAVRNAQLYTDLSQAVQSRDALLAAVVHDLRAPLGIIRARAQVLQRRAPSADLVELGGKIDAASRRMASLLDELVDAAQMKAGAALTLRPGPVDLVALVEDRLADWAPLHPGGVARCSMPGPLWGEWDGPRLERVLDNLLANAVKYSPNAAPVRVKLHRNLGPSGVDWAVLRVVDLGVGIPEADQARLFEPFFRASNVSRLPGTGLGLWGCKQIVELHGGRLDLESKEGVGTVVTVHLPLGPYTPGL